MNAWGQRTNTCGVVHCGFWKLLGHNQGAKIWWFLEIDPRIQYTIPKEASAAMTEAIRQTWFPSCQTSKKNNPVNTVFFEIDTKKKHGTPWPESQSHISEGQKDKILVVFSEVLQRTLLLVHGRESAICDEPILMPQTICSPCRFRRHCHAPWKHWSPTECHLRLPPNCCYIPSPPKLSPSFAE